MTIITIDESSRIEIPAAIRIQLGLHPLENLELEVSEGRIILHLLSQSSRLRHEGTALVLETPPLSSQEDMNNLIENLREDRIQS
ncbi:MULTISPECIES: AbrB/MazE/SpoVT family DNA-binding domain-containing protein [Cyanophyceae]|uniref:AbrB/MazE/SpoVT family DNA-binding domain-containing protein n=1 Tax=Cyanophyceae TaxID=3028117 RepID=UPI001688201A|nr:MULTISPECIES: AbrB/MazE/SpoVT family DNA-binding domain-containing protein [Cyanophyceae]MBD1915274.1 AbrB/MazE/SpoVT family DNA-binding domain-containing protein [Phormidium sp. FACHB-77]MBD2032449.1 AbrB/MazE/SpoVT family DNA-binding domain-containing protein [Phormidium sp. FACHB-322]MBD2051020.1 AbrB/MazE/SpoVT family DNA-binding domain-containing protein [Leptolyngbya sp. FACHB-60]